MKLIDGGLTVVIKSMFVAENGDDENEYEYR
jgi:hypothetical protein